jgi:spermidine synthase
MLVAFLVGIAIGSALWARGAAGSVPGPGTLAAILVGIAASALVMIPTFDRFPGLVAYAFSLSSDADFILGVELVLSVALMLGPTLLIGAAFPCALGLVARDTGRVGRDVGGLYAANTAGAIVGAAAAGLLLVPRLGAQNAVKGAALLQLLAAGVVVASVLPSWTVWRRAVALGLAAVIVVGAAAIPRWNRSVIASGAAVYGMAYGRLIDKVSLAELTRPQQLLFYEEGPTATVTVHQGSYRFLRANGKTEASSGPDMHTQLLLGHLPMLLHPDPRRVLVVGLGSGITAGAVARYPVERIDVVEIEPAMTRAAQFFRRENRDVLADPRVVVTIADARNFLLTRDDRFDVIISEPSNPWVGGVATLFTSEFYALAASRLNRDGVMVQWVQSYALAPADLQMITRTFRTAFPGTELWAPVPGDYLLLGRAPGTPFPFERVAARWVERAEVREDLRRVFLTAPAALLSDFVLGPADTARYAEGARVNTDDRLPLEFSAPRSLHRETVDANWQLAHRFRSVELAPVPDDAAARHAMGVAYMAKQRPADALAEFDRALARDPAHVPSLLERGRVLRVRGEHAAALAALDRAVRREPRNALVHYEIGVTREARSGPAAALDAYRQAVALAPDRPDFMRAYATALAQEGRVTEAISYLVLARAFRPRDPALMDLTAFIYLQIGHTARALELLQQAVAVAPREAVYHLRLGQAQMQAKNPAAALAELGRAVELRPDFVEAQLELANTYMLAGQLGPAVTAYRRVLALDPSNTMALRVLSTLLQ